MVTVAWIVLFESFSKVSVDSCYTANWDNQSDIWAPVVGLSSTSSMQHCTVCVVYEVTVVFFRISNFVNGNSTRV